MAKQEGSKERKEADTRFDTVLFFLLVTGQAAQGQWYGGTYPDCDPNPCPPPVPVERTTWGRIKEHYR